MRIFLAGPGGVGKSTAASILAPMLGYHLVDLDSRFMSRIGYIGEVIKTNGYQEYVRLNSRLFFDLINELKENSLFVLSSGFLAINHDPELVQLHRAAVRDLGRPVVLLPSTSYEDSERVVLERQLARGFGPCLVEHRPSPAVHDFSIAEIPAQTASFLVRSRPVAF